MSLVFDGRSWVFGNKAVGDGAKPASPPMAISLSNKPSASSYGIGSTIIKTGDYIIFMDSNGVDWYSRGYSESLSNRPTATLFGKGEWRSMDGGAYCDGVSWSFYRQLPSIKKTTGFNVQPFANGISDLVSSTPGAGATVSAGLDGGIRLVSTAGKSVNSSITFNVTPFRLDADTKIVVKFRTKNLIAAYSMRMDVTTQASNFANGEKVTKTITGYGNIAEEGYCHLVATGAEFFADTTYNPGYSAGQMVDRMKLVPALTQSADITLLGVYITPVNQTPVSITFDDAHITQYTEAFNYMSRFGLTGTVAVISSYIGSANKLTLDMMREMYASGWDFWNHTHEHTSVNGGYGTGTVDQVALAQTITAGNTFTLSGSIGTAVFDAPRMLIMNHSTNEAYRRLTIVGLDENGLAVTETAACTGLNTYQLGKTVWTKIDSITSIDGTAGAVAIGVSMSYGEIYYQIKTCQDFLRNNGFYRGLNGFVAPGGYINALAYRVCDALGITRVRLTHNAYDEPLVAPVPRGIASWANGIASGGSATTISYKDAAKARFCPISYFLHSIVEDSVTPGTSEARVSDFRLFIDNIAADVKAGGIINVNLSEYCDLYDFK